MYPYAPPAPLYPHQGPSVSAGAHFRRYERSPPPVQRSFSVTIRTATNDESTSQDLTLTLRQQPKEALVTTEGKEKARKPVDPPPIIQLTVKPQADPPQHFLQSPYLFMCTSLYKVDRNEAWDGNASKSLAGSLVSSLHRLKDVDNKDGGFFVFGDISVKIQGTFRLHFSLFDLHKDTNEVQYLGSITSDPFRVLLPKDFKGMDESTYLSRAFSDQGVRLRLRKEPRAMMGNKRPYPYGNDTPITNTPIRPNMHEYSSYEELSSPNKRIRTETEDTKREVFSESSGVSGAAFTPSYASSQYTTRQPSITSGYNIGAQYPTFGGMTTGSTSPYQFRPSIGHTSNYFTDPLLQTSGSGLGSGTMAPQQRYDMQQHNFSHLYSTYGQQRGPNASLPFADDASGLNVYRPSSNIGLGDEHRPATTTGIPNSVSMAQQTPQSQNSSHQSHESMSSSRGASFSHSPDLVRSSGGFTDRLQLGSQLPNPHRPSVRFDDTTQLNAGLPVYSRYWSNTTFAPLQSGLESTH